MKRNRDIRVNKAAVSNISMADDPVNRSCFSREQQRQINVQIIVAESLLDVFQRPKSIPMPTFE